MIQFAAVAASALPELVKLLTSVLEDPDTYRKLDGLRQLLSELTGIEIDQNGLVALLEGATQGEPYTGTWETIKPSANDERAFAGGRRLRVEGGWIYDTGRGHPIFVPDR